MELSRRDALAALAGLGLGVGAVGGGAAGGELVARGPPVADNGGDDSFDGDDDLLAVLVAAAEVLYPAAVENHGPFVETYVRGRGRRDPDHREGVIEAAAELDAVARDWYDDPFAELPPETRDRLLRDLGVDVADPDPTGSISGRLRFFVVNDLLYALYTSPTGGRLVGTENPTGYPGGVESYRRGPEALDDG